MALRAINTTGKAPKVFSGARGKVYIENPNGGGNQLIGIFSNISYNVTYDTTPAYILGRWTPAEIDYSSVSPVNITAGGWRVVGLGPHEGGQLPRIQDLLLHQYLTIQIFDRETQEYVATIQFVRPTGFHSNVTARQLSDMTLSYVGILVEDEDVNTNAEPGDSTNLNVAPQGG